MNFLFLGLVPPMNIFNSKYSKYDFCDAQQQQMFLLCKYVYLSSEF